MSGYKTHIIVYLLIVGILLWIINSHNLINLELMNTMTGIFIGTIYSILPDIDSPSSKMRKLTSKTSLALIILCLLGYLLNSKKILIYTAIFLAFFLYILWFFRHRGFFHTITAGIILSLPLAVINLYYVGFALLGFLSHLLLDKLFR